ncbi:phosphatidate cytidylyltransferase [Thiohalophilus sp.]|uniref:phosphatidate cytidylyltransferase n=1 Tax=Thiohalophilus sp. TaxID=3028392 RepID=UPI0039752767
MLKQRMITALILAPLLIWAIFSLPESGFVVLLLTVFSIAAWEWSRLSGLTQPGSRLFYVVILFVVMGVTGFAFASHPLLIDILYLAIGGLWLLTLPGLFYYQHHEVKRSGFNLFKLLAGIGIILGPFVALLVLRHREPFGPQWVMYLLLLIWLADSAAYFAGRAFGRHKLLYNVSPGKSWEGVAGGLLGCLVLSVVAGWWFELSMTHYIWFVAVSLVVVLFSVAGDLVESLFKRQAGMKDSGHILPGHGGILDRIDSLTAAAPVFASGLYLAGLFA